MKVKSIALLIDAENVSPKTLEFVFRKLESIGAIGIKRAYANWTVNDSEHWRCALASYAIDPIHQYMVSAKKNAADIRIVVDAMTLALSDGVDNFCIVSSDSDYAPLAIALRQANKLVLGFGLHHTPKRTALAYDHFYQIPYSSKASTSYVTTNHDLIRQQCSHIILEYIKYSPIAVSILNLTTKTRIKNMKLSPDWCGEGNFTKFLHSLDLGSLQIKNNYIFCPSRHIVPG